MDLFVNMHTSIQLDVGHDRLIFNVVGPIVFEKSPKFSRKTKEVQSSCCNLIGQFQIQFKLLTEYKTTGAHIENHSWPFIKANKILQ